MTTQPEPSPGPDRCSQEAVEQAAIILRDSLREQLARPAVEAAKLAYHHGGPSIEELEIRIRARQMGELPSTQ